ncbi:hypothetical protein [Micromonospora sp. L5]|uniref:hypothetical protein n=1 Tax=Micromonospora sp. (strain L5) TaxID=648999 RepID=UPI001180B77B|nr:MULTISPECIES: hypothetical protein [Micromonospora]
MGNRMSIYLMFSILLGLWIYSITHLDWNAWWALTAIIMSLFVGGALIGYAKLSAKAFYLFFLGLWGASFAHLIIVDGFDAVLPTHVLPLVIVPTLRGVGSAATIATQLPLFIPVSLIIVLLPLLTEDPWRLAAAARDRLGWFAALALLPPMMLLAWRIMRTQSANVLHTAADRLSGLSDRDAVALREIKKMRHSRDQELDEASMRREIRSAMETDQPEEAAARILEAARTSTRLRAARRLGSLALGVSVIIWALIYSLAWASMPVSLAADWSKAEVTFETLNIFWVNITVPVAPYVWVSTLLAIVACAGFFGFALTEDQHSDALWETVVQKPADTYLLMALPYLQAFGGGDRIESKTKSSSNLLTPRQRPRGDASKGSENAPGRRSKSHKQRPTK